MKRNCEFIANIENFLLNIPFFKSQKWYVKGVERGFTLAEILITLTIIGIVAAVTVPSLVNNTGDAQISTGVKNIYQILSEATEKAETDSEGNGLNLSSESNFMASLVPYLKTMSYGIGPLKALNNNPFYSCYKGSSTNCDDTTVYKIWKGSASTRPYVQLNNGAVVFIIEVISGDDPYKIFVDINGIKGPNMYGKDFVMFELITDANGSTHSIMPPILAPDGNTLTCQPGSKSLTTSFGCVSYYITGNTLP
jgi:prepilin-type N-terminal cleavage/methylation domain-containing protein